jgi:hypothetical protein
MRSSWVERLGASALAVNFQTLTNIFGELRRGDALHLFRHI